MQLGERKMVNNYSALLDYIEYFNDETNKFYTIHEGKEINGVFYIGGSAYSDKVNELIKKSYEIEFIYIGDYSDWFDSKRSSADEIIQIISSSNLEMLRKIFTFFIRKERFCEGTLVSAIDNKIIINILFRLKELLS
jgi:hypothetical protein